MKFTSPVYSAASGSIAGLTYSRNRGGMYTRARAVPTNPNSTAQQGIRNSFSSLATRWRETLTQAQRDAWQNYAENTPLVDSLGSELVLSGQQMYNRCNSVRLYTTAPLVDDGPTTMGEADLSLLTLSSAASTISLKWDDTDPWADQDEGRLIIQCSRYLEPTINFFKGPFRFQNSIPGENGSPPAGPYSFSTNVFNQDAANFTGKRVFMRVRASDNQGRLSPVQIVSTEIVVV